MAIITVDGLLAAMGAATAQRIPLVRSSIASQGAGGYSSLWRATGGPGGQGAIPGAASIPTQTTTGALANFNNPSGGASTYLARVMLSAANSGSDLAFYDRLSHMGGLSGAATGAQTVGCDVSSLAGTRCAADLSDVEWWVEIYTDIGTSAQTATVTYVRDSDASSQTTTLSIGGASPLNQDSRMFRFFPNPGDVIRSVTSIQHASTGTAGSYGVTACRYLASVAAPIANQSIVYDWAQLGFPAVPDDACLFNIMTCSTTSTGALAGAVLLVQG